MKKFLVFLLAGIISLSVIGCKNTENHDLKDPKGTKIIIDGKEEHLISYDIKGDDYFNICDVAIALKETKAKFDISWDKDENSIHISTNKTFSGDQEISSEILENPSAISMTSTVYKDDVQIFLGTYDIAGEIFSKLTDIARLLDFGISTSNGDTLFEIDTTQSFNFKENPKDEFVFNPEPLSLFGKTKGEVDAMFGKGDFWREWALVVHDNGYQISYNTYNLNGDLDDSDYVYAMYVPLKYLFYNCPDNPTKLQLESAFSFTKESYIEEDGTTALVADYFGTNIYFYTEWGLTKDDCAFIKLSDGSSSNKETLNLSKEMTESPKTAEENLSSPKFEGYYETDEWVDGSYVKISKNGSSYKVELLLVRGASFENATGTQVDEKTMKISGGDVHEGVTFTWSDDYKNLTVTSPDESWAYMVSSSPITFYKK